MIQILRGLPGSGKTRFANQIARAEIFSADHWHMINGYYQFDPKRAGYAHNECFKCFLSAAMVEKSNQLVVDNTNTSLVELAPYVRVADAFNLPYKIVYLMCDVETAIRRNVHGVPANTILAMQRNLLTEIVPAYWHQEVVLP